MDTFWLVARVVLALACVLGLVWVAARKVGGGRRASTEPQLRVVGRTALGRHAGIAVLAVGDRRLLVGYGERQVELLSELDVHRPQDTPAAALPDTTPHRPADAAARTLPDELWDTTVPLPAAALPAVAPATVPTRRERRASGALVAVPAQRPAPVLVPRPAPTGPLAGSALSPRTWKDAVRTMQDRTVRR